MKKKPMPLEPSEWQTLVKEIEPLASRLRALPKDEAEALLIGQCEAIFATHFEATESLEEAKALALTQKLDADKRTQSIAEALLSTPKRLDAPLEAQGLLSGGLSQLRINDAIQLLLFGGLTGLSMWTAYSNVLANLIGTGNPVFLDSPSVASGIAIIAPAAAVAIKILPSAFKRDAAQALCKRFITALTALGVLGWLILFSVSFDGLSNNLPDLNDFSLEGNSTGNWLSFTQLFVEIMVSACLFIRFSDILAIYEPQHKANNPEWDKLSADLEQAKLVSASAQTAFEKASNALSQHLAAKHAFINETLGRLALLHAQYSDLHQ